MVVGYTNLREAIQVFALRVGIFQLPSWVDPNQKGLRHERSLFCYLGIPYMKTKIKFEIHHWNADRGCWQPFTVIDAYTKKQACYLASLRYPFRRSDLSAKSLASVEDIPLEDDQNESASAYNS